MPAMARTSAASVRPCPKASSHSCGARTASAQAAGTVTTAIVRTVRERIPRTAARSSAAALNEGRTAVTTDTVTTPCGTIHSRYALPYAVYPTPGSPAAAACSPASVDSRVTTQ